MKLLDLLLTILVIAILAAMLGPRLVAAKNAIVDKWVSVNIQHHERIDYLASGALEDPRAHWTTEKDVQESLAYFSTLDMR